MPRPEKPLPQDGGTVAEFARDLRELRRVSGLTYKQMAKTAYYSVTVLSQAAAGHRLPTWDVTVKFVQACGGDPADWMTRWEQARLAPEAKSHRLRKLAPAAFIAVVALSAALVIALLPSDDTNTAELPLDAPTMDLTSLASRATWRTGVGELPFPGLETEDRGFVLTRPFQDPGGACAKSADNARVVLETHPQWVDRGYVEGTYPLPRSIVAGDHFRAKIGFRDCAKLLGDVLFSVEVRMPDGTVRDVYSRQLVADGRPLSAVDVDLSPYQGATAVLLRVFAGESSEQDWAIWAAPRIER